MINLRYHIVSITAVFLALGIGLTLGSSFLDRVTVDNLKDRLDTVQERVQKAESANNSLTDRVEALDERDGELSTELPERLLTGHLADVPVLVIAAESTDEALVDRTVAALVAAGAQVSGSWWLSDRWDLDDRAEVKDLGTLLEVSSTEPTRLRRNSAIRMAELLTAASRIPAEIEAPSPEDAPAPPPSEPVLVRALEEAGFLDYRAVPGASGGRVLLPSSSARYLVISGAQPEAGAQLFLSVLLDELVADGTARVVAAQGQVDLPDAAGAESEDARRATFVGPLRSGEFTRDRLSTVDNLDEAAGLAAVVLALEDLADLRTGHYGVGAGAARLLPGAQPAT